tara:strand:+ start:488 stop:772 length:285 start_codon:yes stop_codon:yes gene_type:complete
MKQYFASCILVGFSVFFFPVVLLADDGVFENDPNGFKGYSWNANIVEFDGLVLWGESEDLSESKTYYFPSELLTVGDINVEKILYSFGGGSFNV